MSIALQRILDEIEHEAAAKTAVALKKQDAIELAFDLGQKLFGADTDRLPHVSEYSHDVHFGVRGSDIREVRAAIAAHGLVIASDTPQPHTGPQDHVLRFRDYPDVELTLYCDPDYAPAEESTC